MDSVILVTGATGTLGRAVVRRLMADELPVRVLSRGPRPMGDRRPVEWVTGDLTTERVAEDAVAGAGTVIHCAKGPRGDDAKVTQRLVEAAQRSGGPHLVYISIVGVDRVPLGYYRSKLAAERVITTSGLPWTILRTTQFHDLVARLTLAQRWLPVVLMPGGRSCVQPIEVTEVAARLAELAGGEPAGRVPDLAGPQVRTAVSLAQATLRARHRRRPVAPLWLPGKAFRAIRAGGLLAPERAVGRVTFEDFLAAER